MEDLLLCILFTMAFVTPFAMSIQFSENTRKREVRYGRFITRKRV